MKFNNKKKFKSRMFVLGMKVQVDQDGWTLHGDDIVTVPITSCVDAIPHILYKMY